MIPRPLQAAQLWAAGAAACFAFSSCSGEQPRYDWRNRDLAWKYGPTHGTASPEHLIGTGTLRGAAMAEGWKVGLSDGKKLTVRPYKLAAQHELFGKAGLILVLYNKDSQELQALRTGAIEPGNATFSFDIEEETAKDTYDLILWFGEA